jgi:hypothetical protein
VWQISPLPHVIPSGASLKADVLTPGWQVWHAFVGFGAPLAYEVAPITHVPPASDPLLEPESDPLLEPESDPLLEPESDPLLEPESDPLLEPESCPLLEPESDPLLEPEPSVVESPAAPSPPPSSMSGTSGKPTRPAHAGTTNRVTASRSRR